MVLVEVPHIKMFLPRDKKKSGNKEIKRLNW
jgi:hypothetical protein